MTTTTTIDREASHMKANRIIPCISTMAMILFASAASATFHLWRMSELFSNADGTVQFVELECAFSGEGFIGGHQLSATGGGTTRVFPSDPAPQGPPRAPRREPAVRASLPPDVTAHGALSST